ncbi:MAG: AAA family ATPase [Candidatus Levybacteria bacterium RIFOXYC1_FULL_40_10]|nr:MAG: AAA family ATPase [Candidatus Levybacteria bacterium RIFCSPLOWO2_01_FULL_40_96]OGH55153.1 MAG: AAA family ATPase [Candidatus Levybacteria bacterium RIFOXYC1_FULL_40_10]OGH70578.1 MAG: AAA family ATPase [Candidatus Levybacteria bacterium RIFOXYB1_FULL_40_17]
MNLAFRLRPTTFDEFVGQTHLTGQAGIVKKIIKSNASFSLIFWGPPGSGKTTLANIIASEINADFHAISAVEAGKADLNKIIEAGKENLNKSIKTILFIDEIHRWNKTQQDALLPYVENGTLNLIGATTENPSFEVISALLSRSRVLVLQGLTFEELEIILDRALKDKEKGLGRYKKKISKNAKELLIRFSGADARIMLNALEIAVTSYNQAEINEKIIEEIFQTKSAGLYDKKAEEHYNIISAFIKSMRGSDTDAALYYMARMLENGEDPKFIARRMIIFAVEDIGMADRGALIQADEAFEAVQKIGMPEAQLILAYVVIYLSKAPKSRAVVNALGKAKKAVYEFPNEPVPLHLRNAPTKLMKNLGYAKNYKWSQNYVGPKENLPFLPKKLAGRKFYEK